MDELTERERTLYDHGFAEGECAGFCARVAAGDVVKEDISEQRLNCLRKQTLGYQKDLALARRVLYYIRKNTFKTTRAHRAAERCIEELKQR